MGHLYICINKAHVQGFLIKWVIHCGETIESQYYNKNGDRGGGIITEYVCLLCYSVDDIVTREEIIDNIDVQGYNPLLVCRTCFDYNIKIPTSGGCGKRQHRSKENITKKKRQLEKSVASSRIKLQKI